MSFDEANNIGKIFQDPINEFIEFQTNTFNPFIQEGSKPIQNNNTIKTNSTEEFVAMTCGDPDIISWTVVFWTIGLKTNE